MTITTVGVTTAAMTRAMTFTMTTGRRQTPHTVPNGEDGNSRFPHGS
ncbi:hypothetical protein [Streptomyces sp. NRRL S-1448]|nr:hypothetical protein [Streptomyces sp. NRRL S-1448]